MGIEPTSSAWKAEVLAFELHPQNRYRVASVRGARPIPSRQVALKSRALTQTVLYVASSLAPENSGGGGRIRTSEGGAVRFTV